MSKPFEDDQLEKSARELADVREAMRTQTLKLTEAEAALRFYADPRNYEPSRKLDGKTVLQDRLKGDFSLADNDANTNLAGAKARGYFKLYESR